MITDLTILGLKGQKARADYALGKYTFVTGNNAASKSTILTGIKMATTGYVPEAAINADSTDAVALVKMNDGKEIKTVASEKSTAHFVDGKKLTKGAVAECRKTALHLDPDTAEVLFRDGQGCLDLKPEEMSKLIGSFIPTMKADDLLKRMKLTADEETLFRKLCPDPGVDFDIIAKAYKELGEKLRVLNKEISAEEQSADILSKTSGLLRPVSVLTTWKDTLLEEKKNLMEELSEAQIQEANARDYENTLKEIQEIRKKLAEKPAAVSAEQIETETESLDITQRQLKEVSEEAAVLTRNIETYQKILDELSSSVCPISRKLVCTTDKSGVRGELEESIQENKSLLESKKRRNVFLESAKASIEANLKQLRNDEKAQMEYHRQEERLKILEGQLKPVTSSTMDMASIEEKIRNIDADIDKTTAELAGAEKVEQAEKLRASAKSKRVEQETADHLRKLLAPKGDAYNILLDAFCGALNTGMNATAADLGCNKEFAFRVENGMTLYGKNIGEPNMIPVRYMSTGERFMAQLVLLSLINKINGLPFIIIDNIDCLDEKNLEKVLALVSNPVYAATFENVILAGVSHNDTMSAIRRFETGRTDVRVIDLA